MLFSRLFSEWLGTAILVAVIIGSGIMAERLSGGNLAIALIANTLATVFGLYVLIELFRPVSGAHFNPAVSIFMVMRRKLKPAILPAYIAAQVIGAIFGALLAQAMFELPIVEWSTKVRSGTGEWISEVVATAGLILVVSRATDGRVASLVAAYIGAAYWFTSSTSFANPAVVIGRMFSDSFAGIEPACAPAFIAAELLGVLLGFGINSLLSIKSSSF